MTRGAALPETVTLHVPFRVVKRGGRKEMQLPDGAAQPRIDSALVKAIARAHRWQRMLESGRYSSVTELAEAEKVNLSYLSRILRLTLLAPDFAEAILDGRQPAEITLARLMRPFPPEWVEQRALAPGAAATDRQPHTDTTARQARLP